jgi:hypothetical protein
MVHEEHNHSSTKKLSVEQRQMLRQQVINEDGPGAILRDFDTLVELVGLDGIRVTDSQHFLPMKVLPQLNASLTRPIQFGLKRAQQKSYPHIHGLYWLLRATGLSYVDEAGAKPRLVLDEEALGSWNGLNPSERYFTLLEAWLLHARPDIIGERGGWHSFPVLSWAYFFQRIPEDGLRVAGDDAAQDMLRYFPGLHVLALLELFGLVHVEHGPPEVKQGWRIIGVYRTQLGDALLALLVPALSDPSYMYEFPEHTQVAFGELQPTVQPYFPEWQSNLLVPEHEFQDGIYVFKVSLGRIWRRIALPAGLTLDSLAAAILNAYEFDFDHLWRFSYQTRFGWPMHVNHPYLDDGPWTSEALVGDLPLKPGDHMLFVYDFGDWWEFDTALERIDPVDADLREPVILESHGEAPEQYPSWEEW